LLPILYQSSINLLKENLEKYGDEVLGVYADIAECEPKFFKKDI